MTVYSNDPVRVQITWKEIEQKLFPMPKGIDITYKKDEEYKDNDIWFVQMVASDTDPYNPNEERYMEEIEHQLNILPVVQDTCKEHYAHKLFPKKKKVVEAVLNERIFGKENRYDVLLDKIKAKHMINGNQVFGTIEDS